jgi:hypothetical protein
MNNLNRNTLAVLLALAGTSVDASLRNGSQYINRGGACESSEIMNRMNFDMNFPNEQSIQEACNADPYCHGYAIWGNSLFYILDSVGGLDNFLLGCNGNALFQVKEKRGETGHAVLDPSTGREDANAVCFDQNRHGSVESCRLSEDDCDLASSNVQEDCCVCGGGRIEEIVTGVDGIISLPLSGTPSYEIETTTSLVLIDNPGQFNGSIPTEIFSLTKLTSLNLSGNDFVGTIPPGIEQLTDLEELFITGNRLQAPLPEGLTSLNKLKVVNIEMLNGM